MLEDCNNSSIGSLAFLYLKTGDIKMLNLLQKWCEDNKNNTDKF